MFLVLKTDCDSSVASAENLFGQGVLNSFLRNPLFFWYDYQTCDVLEKVEIVILVV